MGTVSLGIYSQAYKVMLFPVQNLTLAVGRALYPSLCREQDQPEWMRMRFLKATRMISTLAAPLLLGIIVFRQGFVLLAFGARWSSIAPLLAWLGPTGCIQTLMSLSGTAFMAKGRTDLLLRLGIVTTVTQVSAFLLGSCYGLTSLAQLYFLSNIVNAGIILGVLLPLLKASWQSYLIASLPAFLAALGCMWLAEHVGTAVLPTDGLLTLLISITLGCISYTAIMLVAMPDRVRDFRPILVQFLSKRHT